MPRNPVLVKQDKLIAEMAAELKTTKFQALSFLIAYYRLQDIDALTKNILRRHKEGLSVIDLTKLRILRDVLNNLMPD